jgi:thermosome
MDKMLVERQGEVTVTGDSYGILEKMDVQHPSARMMVEAAKALAEETGDGTTTVVLLSSELLNKAEELMAKQIHPTVMVTGYHRAAKKALETLYKIAIPLESGGKQTVEKVAMTSMAGSLVAEDRQHLANLAASAVLQVAEEDGEHVKVDLDNIMLLSRYGQSVGNTCLINGTVLDREIVHPNMPRRVEKARIAVLDTPLKIERPRLEAKISIRRVGQMESFLEQERKTVERMAEKIVAVGANVLVCHKSIDDLARGYLARKNILTVTHPGKSDMEKLLKATGGNLVGNLGDMTKEDLGYADLVEERKLPGEDVTRLIFVEGCRNPRSVAILVRGSTKYVVDQARRLLRTALCASRNVVEKPEVLVGGGAPEMAMAMELRRYANTISGREQLVIQAYAEALEVLPAALSESAGLNPLTTTLELRSRHENGDRSAGIDVLHRRIGDMTRLDVYEPLSVKEQIIKSATDVVSMIIRIDAILRGRNQETKRKPSESG